MLEPRNATAQRAYFPVARGVIEPEHRKKIGIAVWTFLWLLRYQTSNDGRVKNGDTVTSRGIAADLDMDDASVRRHLTQLENAGYITVEPVDGKGFKVWISKPLLVTKESSLFRERPRTEMHRVDGRHPVQKCTGSTGGSGQICPATPDRNVHPINTEEVRPERERLENAASTLLPSRAQEATPPPADVLAEFARLRARRGTAANPKPGATT